MSQQAWQEVCQTVAQDSPRKVLISSEMLFRPMTSAVIRAANEKIDAIAHSSRIVTYLRAPDGYYLSVLQQALKKLRPAPPNSRTPLKDTVEPLIRNWNGKVDLNVFDRDALKDRDSFIDFMSKYLPEIDLATVPRRAEALNTSLSAEAMSLLYEFASDRTRWPRDAHPLKSEIARADDKIANPTKPKLYPHIREMVLNWNAPDLFWLRDTHGITFPNIDYDALNPGEIDLDALTVGKIENICDVNQDRKAELLRHAIWRARLPVQMRRWLAYY